MEPDFSERLKNYRRAKAMTQQDLADQLGVSNKTVSRWESGGGYPDVPLLVPLARALGVTVDDLLDGEKPIRTLTRADGQSLLSFAFALGGGVLFFLLDLFMPTLLCYLAYLGCMAYGVYLQRYYCYQNRWFRIGNAAMDLSVNLTVVLRLGTGLAALPAAMTIANVQEWRVRLLFWWKDHLPLLLLLGVLLALALTALTLWLVERCGFGRRPVLLRPGLRRPAVRELLPALSLLLLTAFWLLFRLDALPLEAYLRQSLLYGGLAGMLILLCLLLALKKGRRRGLAPTALLLLGADLLPGLGEEWAYLPRSKEFILAKPTLSDLYPRFYRPEPEQVAAGLVLALLCLLLVVVTFRPKAPDEEQEMAPEA